MDKEIEKNILNYKEIAQQTVEIEKTTAKLMDEVLEILDKEVDYEEIRKKAYYLSLKTSKIIQEIREKKKLDEIEKQKKTFEKIQLEAKVLIESLGDSVIIKNQKKLNGEFEAIVNSINRIKRQLDLISLPHLQQKQRKMIENEITDSLKIAKHRIRLIDVFLMNKKPLQNYFIYYNLKQIIEKIQEISLIKQEIEKELKERKIADYCRMFNKQIKKFFLSELEGTIYIDKSTIRLNSKLSGRIEEYPINSINKKALQILFEGNERLERILDQIDKEKISIIGDFSSLHENNGLKVLFDLKERKILFDTIIAKPLKIKIMI
ncbi:MAG: hypothetical protein ACK4J0_01075 [Candidatus Anstonellaceae archaeon]